MINERVRPALNLSIATAFAVVLGACAGSQTTVQEPAVAPEMPATIRADQIVGRWGVASYQDPKDRTRVEAAAKAQCKLPYVITAGASGGVVMHLADEATPQELRLKGSPGGKNYIGPPACGFPRFIPIHLSGDRGSTAIVVPVEPLALAAVSEADLETAAVGDALRIMRDDTNAIGHRPRFRSRAIVQIRFHRRSSGGFCLRERRSASFRLRLDMYARK
jgi:hypothetical protein